MTYINYMMVHMHTLPIMVKYMITH
jgi:hypothetical protein